MNAAAMAALAALALLGAPEIGARAPGARRGVADAVPPSPFSLGSALSVAWLREPSSHMVRIPSGAFRMGSTGEEVVEALVDCQHEPRGTECDPSLFANEGPVRTVALSAFFLDRTEVTVRDYARCVIAGRCRAVPAALGAARFFARESFPMTLVSWDDAHDYCAFRDARLPTEAEYERAARGPSGRKYPWGNLYASGAVNHGRFSWNAADAGDGFAELAPVGSFPSGRSPDGVDDLAGNVSEWVSDRYAAEYSPTDSVDPRGPDVSTSLPSRVVRGGSWESAAPFLRGAARAALEPGSRKPTVGFRCARSRHGRGP